MLNFRCWPTYGIFFVLNSKTFSEQFALKGLKEFILKTTIRCLEPDYIQIAALICLPQIYKCGVTTGQWWSTGSPVMTGSPPPITALGPQNTAVCNAAISPAYISACLLSLSSYTWKWGGRVNGRDPGDKNNPCPYKWSLSSYSAHRHTNRQTHPHTAWPRSVATGPESRDCALKKRTARPHWNQRERRQRSLYE